MRQGYATIFTTESRAWFAMRSSVASSAPPTLTAPMTYPSAVTIGTPPATGRRLESTRWGGATRIWGGRGEGRELSRWDTTQGRGVSLASRGLHAEKANAVVTEKNLRDGTSVDHDSAHLVPLGPSCFQSGKCGAVRDLVAERLSH
jgi:hypothetical protein